MPRIHPELRIRARELRQPLTQAEQVLWERLRNFQLGGFKFRRQHPIGAFIVDFYCAQVRLVIEIDGSSHLDQKDYDDYRTGWLELNGFRVIRFTNSEVGEEIETVLEVIGENCRI
jgi:very-short-patch-repair endonuclease